jgi:hypothetical protein
LKEDIMAREGVPILVKIWLTRDPLGNVVHDFPDWRRLPLEANRGERHEDHQIVKWRYDKRYGHSDEATDSPVGTWLGMMVVTNTFANEAVAMFPARVSIMTDTQAKVFWEDRANYGRSVEQIDTEILRGLQAQRDLTLTLNPLANVSVLDARIAKALDPNDSEPGVRKVEDRAWADAKTKLAFSIRA